MILKLLKNANFEFLKLSFRPRVIKEICFLRFSKKLKKLKLFKKQFKEKSFKKKQDLQVPV